MNDWMTVVHSILSSEGKYQFHALRSILLNSADILRHLIDERCSLNKTALIVGEKCFTDIDELEERLISAGPSYFIFVVSHSLIELTVNINSLRTITSYF